MLGREVGTGQVQRREEQGHLRVGEDEAVVGRRRLAVEPLVQAVRRRDLGGRRRWQEAEAEGVGPLVLVEGAGERGRVGELEAPDHPFGVPALLGRLAGERRERDGVGPGDHRGDAGLLHAGDDAGRQLLGPAGVEGELARLDDVDPLLVERLDVPVDPALVGIVLGEVEQPEHAVGALAALARELGRAARQLLGHVGHDVRLDL